MFIYMLHIICGGQNLMLEKIFFLLLSTLYTEAGLLLGLWLVDSSSLTRQLIWRISSRLHLPSVGITLSLVFISLLGLELSPHIVWQVLHPLSNLASPRTCSWLALKQNHWASENIILLKEVWLLKYHCACVYTFVSVHRVYTYARTHTHTSWNINDFPQYQWWSYLKKDKALILQKASHFLVFLWLWPVNTPCDSVLKTSSTELDQKSVSGLLDMYMYVNKSKTWNPKISKHKEENLQFVILIKLFSKFSKYTQVWVGKGSVL